MPITPHEFPWFVAQAAGPHRVSVWTQNLTNLNMPRLSLSSKFACQIHEAHRGLSTGSILVILLLAFTGVYLLVGAVALHFLRGAIGWEMIPNYDFWAEIPGLFRLDWQPVNDREAVRSTKNSNARSTASAPSISYPDLADIESNFHFHEKGSKDELSSLLPGSTPPSSIGGFPVAEKKQSNNNNNSANNHHTNGDIQQGQTKKLVRKEQSLSSSVNRDVPAAEWSSRRGSNSQLSHTSTPANVWPRPNVPGGSNEPSVDGVSSSENLLDIGPQIAAVENGFGANWWNEPAPMLNQPQNGYEK